MIDLVPPVRPYEPFTNGSLPFINGSSHWSIYLPLTNGGFISVREVLLANDISVWEVRELYFINSSIINSYFSYEYHPPLILYFKPSLFLYLVPSSPLPPQPLYP